MGLILAKAWNDNEIQKVNESDTDSVKLSSTVITESSVNNESIFESQITTENLKDSKQETRPDYVLKTVEVVPVDILHNHIIKK
jgi:hypothetical protein